MHNHNHSHSNNIPHHLYSPPPPLQAHDDSEEIWDQLNDEQSREVQQHESRFQAAPLHSRQRPGVIVASVVAGTLERIQETAVSAVGAAQEAWSNYPHQQYQPASTTDDSLDRQFQLQEDLQYPSRSQTETTQLSPSEEEGRNNPYVLLRPFRLTPPREGWGAVPNLDVFLTHLYHYYYHRGWNPIVYQGVVELLILMVTLWLSVFLVTRLDWPQLATCKDESSCQEQLSNYIVLETSNHWWKWWIRGYTFFFASYTLFSIWKFYKTLQHSIQSKWVLEEKLGISARKLQGGAVAWDDVVQKLVEVQERGEYRLVVHGPQLDALQIAQRIMRKENFLIALLNQNVLNCSVGPGGRFYFGKSMEWSMYLCLLNFLFNHKYEIRPAFYLDPASLQRRFVVCGILHALFLPFLLLFMSLHFLLQNAYDFKTTKNMGPRDWSLSAKWTFREFNELPHILERRLEPSYKAAEVYLNLFGQSEVLAAVGKILVFLSGAVGGVLLVFGVLNDAILLHVQLFGRNLLWYAGLAGMAYTIGKALLPTKEATPSVTRNLFQDMDVGLKNVSNHTHYYPDIWKGRGWDHKVHKNFQIFIDTKVKLFVYELAAILVAPYILCRLLPKNAEAICELCLALKQKVAGAGDMCGYATYDFDKYGDEVWEGQNKKSPHLQESMAESILRMGNVEEARRLHEKPKSREGKMEKSFFNFKEAHPSWKCSESGQHLVDQVEEYKKVELAARSRERELHIDAAARQLETLARLEQQQRQQPPQDPFQAIPSTIDERYIPRVPPADAGAGSQAQGIPPAGLSPNHTPSISPPPGPPSASLETRQSHMSSSVRFTDMAENTSQQHQPSSHMESSRGSVPFASSIATTSPPNSPRNALRAGLSTELRRILSMSIADASESVLQEHQPLDNDNASERQVIFRWHSIGG
jgi:autophagy-related protein 9